MNLIEETTIDSFTIVLIRYVNYSIICNPIWFVWLNLPLWKSIID